MPVQIFDRINSPNLGAPLRAELDRIETNLRLFQPGVRFDANGERAHARATGWLDQLRMRPQGALFGDAGPGSKASIGWMLAFDPTYKEREMTAEFLELAKAARAGDRTMPEDPNQYSYLMVPGLFTEHYLGYMDENIRRLGELGCQNVIKSSIDTDAGQRANAEKIKDEIIALARETGKKVVIFGHSKGGVDASDALEMYTDELKDYVKAYIPMQAPFGGTPIATDIGDSPAVSQLMGAIIKGVFQGDPQALSDLAYPARRALYANGVNFTKHIPTFSLATSSKDPFSLVGLPSTYMRNRYGADNDGLVPRDDAIVPGSRGVILLDGMDHTMPTMKSGRRAMQPGDLTQALLALALLHTRS